MEWLTSNAGIALLNAVALAANSAVVILEGPHPVPVICVLVSGVFCALYGVRALL